MSYNDPTKEFPQLETKRLVLRQLTLDDTETIFQNFADEEITKPLCMEPLTNSHGATAIIKRFLEQYQQEIGLTWAMVFKEETRVIGTCGYENLYRSHFRGEIGYDLSKAYWGNGIMTEALQAIIAYGFEYLDLNRMKP